MKFVLNIAICDGNHRDAMEVMSFARAYQNSAPELAFRIYVCHTAAELSSLPAQIQIFFMETGLPDADGVALAKKLREGHPGAVVIFVTSSRRHALEAYGVPALRYLLKPVSGAELTSALQDALRFVDELPGARFRIKTADGVHFIPLSQIVYFQPKNHTVHVFLRDGKEVVSRTLHTTFTELTAPLIESGDFLRTHHSYVVNRAFIDCMTVDSFLMITGKTIPISESRYASVRAAWERAEPAGGR